MDDELFRTYFVRLFRGIRQMEKRFNELSDPEESDTFVNFSKALKDLASLFKLNKRETSLSKDERATLLKKNLKKKTFKRNQHELCKMIFGVGQTPAEVRNKTLTFRILPTKLLGFSKVQ